jgi:hypothetical protein
VTLARRPRRRGKRPASTHVRDGKSMGWRRAPALPPFVPARTLQAEIPWDRPGPAAADCRAPQAGSFWQLWRCILRHHSCARSRVVSPTATRSSEPLHILSVMAPRPTVARRIGSRVRHSATTARPFWWRPSNYEWRLVPRLPFSRRTGWRRSLPSRSISLPTPSRSGIVRAGRPSSESSPACRRTCVGLNPSVNADVPVPTGAVRVRTLVTCRSSERCLCHTR